MHPVIEAIYARRSVRDFSPEPVEEKDLVEIIRAGMWAPSGLNNQPWRFATICNPELKAGIAHLTRYRRVVEGAQALIAVFVDREAIYHDVKDHQAIGACLQNMLLVTHALGLGAVWLGEILKNAGPVRELLGLPENLELMAVVAIGHPAHRRQESSRKPVDEMLLLKK